jgi:hypothetical protein
MARRILARKATGSTQTHTRTSNVRRARTLTLIGSEKSPQGRHRAGAVHFMDSEVPCIVSRRLRRLARGEKHMRFGLTGIGLGLLALAAFAAACQTYDFEPVDPLAISQRTEKVLVTARAGKPNVMLVVDKSGSMLFPVDPSNPNCPANCGPPPGNTPCPSNCPTRLSDMKAAMGPFLSQSGSLARFGLTGFPVPTSADPFCPAGQLVRDIPDVPNDDPALLQSAASQVNDAIQQIAPAGGTPTAATLRTLLDLPTLLDPDRRNIVLLLTDGLPNCNGQLDRQTCICVSTGATPCDNSLNCLDRDNSVAAVTSLRQKGIDTIVIGFGSDTGGALAFPTLTAMAEAGGFQRFYQAADGAALTQILAELTAYFDETPCTYTFSASDAPTNPSACIAGAPDCFIVAYVNGEKQTLGAAWNYSEPNGVPTVTFTGSACTLLENSTLREPVDVQIQLLQTL